MTVGNGDVLCVIEAMKLNEIESEVSGKIVKIPVDDNSPVEYDQPLFLASFLNIPHHVQENPDRQPR